MDRNIEKILNSVLLVNKQKSVPKTGDFVDVVAGDHSFALFCEVLQSSEKAKLSDQSKKTKAYEVSSERAPIFWTTPELVSSWGFSTRFIPQDVEQSSKIVRASRAYQNWLQEKSLDPSFSGGVFLTSSGSSSRVLEDRKWFFFSFPSIRERAEISLKGLGIESSRVLTWGTQLPLYHVSGFMALVRSLWGRGRFFYFSESWNPHSYYNWLVENQISETSIIPLQLYDLLERNLKPPSSLRRVLCGGGGLSSTVLERAWSLGWPVCPVYGGTETLAFFAVGQLKRKKKQPARTSLKEMNSKIIYRTLAGSRCVIPQRGVSAAWGKQGAPAKLKFHFSRSVYAEGFFSKDPKILERTIQYFKLSSLMSLGDRGVVHSSRSFEILGRDDDRVKIKGRWVNLRELSEDFTHFLRTNLCTSDSGQGGMKRAGQEVHSYSRIVAIPDERLGFQLLAVVPIFRGFSEQQVHGLWRDWVSDYPQLSFSLVILKGKEKQSVFTELGKIRRYRLVQLWKRRKL